MTLNLPPAHPKQHELINAFDLRYDPLRPDKHFIEPDDPDYAGRWEQLPLVHPGLRFIIGACGSKFGKTYGCSSRIVMEAWNNPSSLNWWVAPTYAQSKMAYLQIKRLLPTETSCGYKSYDEEKADLRLNILNPDGSHRSTIEFKSGDNPDSLRGFAVNFAILDEAARIPYESYISVWTTMSQTLGRMIIISTPNGRGWFYDEYQKGDKTLLMPDEEDGHPEWWSIRMPTWENPTVTERALRDLKNNLPEDVYRQEIAALFLLDSAGVFKGTHGCVKGTFEPRQKGHHYVMGVDLARIRDYSVITVVDRARNHVVYFDRFKDQSWEVQYSKIIEVAKRYDAVVCMDTTGIGDPICQTVQNAGIHVEGYKISGSVAKQQLIDKLRVNIENQEVSFPKIPILIKELEDYQYKISDSGNFKYSAPSGRHDDTVISLALANWIGSTPVWVYKHKLVRGV